MLKAFFYQTGCRTRGAGLGTPVLDLKETKKRGSFSVGAMTCRETNVNTKYETRVFYASKRLAFIHKDDRPSTLTFEAWTCPDLLDASGLDKSVSSPKRLKCRF